VVRRLAFSAVTAVAAIASAQEAPDEAQLRAVAEARCAARDASCDWLGTFSSLERSSALRALAARGYEVESSPWGKVIGHVFVYNEDVFAEPTPLLWIGNYLHYTTREQSIRDELTIQAGELWDQARVEESTRRLRDPLYSSVVIAFPVKSREPGKVDLLVVTRDVWSIRLNTNYTIQEGKLTNLSISLSENNFLGHRNVLAGALTMDQGSIAVGPLFIDKNVAGSHLTLSARVDDILTRPNSLAAGPYKSEGSDSTISLAKPLWSLASEWGWGVAFTHRYAISRQFLGTSLRTYDDPDTPQDDMLPWKYSSKHWNLQANAVRQFGTDIKHQVGGGWAIDRLLVRPTDDFPGDDMQRAGFIRDVLPRSEVQSGPFVNYAAFTPTYKTFRNISSYDLAEDVQLGPSLSTALTLGLHGFGSDYNFARGSLTLSYAFPFGRDGYMAAAGSVGLRLRGDTPVDEHPNVTFIDNSASTTIRVVSPTIGIGRFVEQSTLATQWNNTQNGFLALGSDSGLRGFLINQFIGQRAVQTNVEYRTVPYAIWVLRLGGVLFYDLGGVTDSLATMQLHHDIGVGVRMLIPQTSRQLFRFDLAFPLDTTYLIAGGMLYRYPAGQPRLILSFDQYF
jgi:outer membrane protein assembly factor BamA